MIYFFFVRGGSQRYLWTVVNYAALVKLDFAGYKFDENDRDSAILRLQFARFPGSRSGGGHRGKRWMVWFGRWLALLSICSGLGYSLIGLIDAEIIIRSKSSKGISM